MRVLYANPCRDTIDILHVLGRLFDLPHIIEEARGLGHDGSFTNLTLWIQPFMCSVLSTFFTSMNELFDVWDMFSLILCTYESKSCWIWDRPQLISKHKRKRQKIELTKNDALTQRHKILVWKPWDGENHESPQAQTKTLYREEIH